MYQKADLTNCDRELIHIINTVQQFGFLLVVDLELNTILQASENAILFLNLPLEKVLHTSIHHIFPDDIIQKIKGELNKKDASLLRYSELKINEKTFELFLHQHKHYYLLEFEEELESIPKIASQVMLAEAIEVIHKSDDIPTLLECTVKELKRISGFDRVMLYQFDKYWNGEVIAESVRDDWEAYLGLHYPASDIPLPAREIYKKTWVRIIYDVETPQVPIVPYPNPITEGPLDLTHLVMRGVSPIHIEYLNNMGVKSTMSIAIIINDKLWGLISFHHASPRKINPNVREACNLIGKVFSSTLSLRITEEIMIEEKRVKEVRFKLEEQIRKYKNIENGLLKGEVVLTDINNADGAALYVNNKWYLVGNTPEETDLHELAYWIKDKFRDLLFYTDNLSSQFENAINYKEVASGLLAVDITADEFDCICWFKAERLKTVHWGGNPEQAKIMTAGGTQLHPRTSFKKWKEIVKNHSDPWKPLEIEKAKKLANNILQLIVKEFSELRELNQQLQEAIEEVEVFSYAISHDLRAPLRSLDGFAEILLEDYQELLDDYGRNLLVELGTCAREMNVMVEDILEYSKISIQAERMQLLDVPQLIRPLFETLKNVGDFPNATLKFKPMPKAFGDKTFIKLLLQNLLSNSLKYSSHKNPQVILAGGFSQEKEDIFFIRDYGIGVDEKDVNRIFNLFVRIDPKEQYEGYGVGLAFAKRIVQKHQGRIWVESVKGEGATFYFALPRYKNGGVWDLINHVNNE